LEVESFRVEQKIIASDHLNGGDGANTEYDGVAGLKREDALTALFRRSKAAFDCLILSLSEIRESEISFVPRANERS